MNKLRKNKGSFLAEILIGSAIISVGIIAIISTFVVYVQYAFANEKNVEANYLLEEGIEAVTFFRDSGWDNNIAKLSTTTAYYLVFSGSSISTSTSAQYTDGIFLRSFSISDVTRDANDDISASGTFDPFTKKITARVEYWQGHSTTTKSLSTYISNIYNN